MKKALACGLIAGSLVVLVAAGPSSLPQQDDEALQRVGQLSKQLADLALRVSELEHANGGAARAPSADSSSSAAAPTRTMVLVSVSQADHTEDHSEEIGQLRRHHSSLMNTVNQYAEQGAADAGQVGYAVRGRGYRGSAVTTNIGAVGRQVMGDKRMENRYASLAAIKKQQADSLQMADSAPKQILQGHDEDNTIFILDSKVDLSSSLNDIAIGDTVTWTGTRLSADEGSETWRIASISKVDE